MKLRIFVLFLAACSLFAQVPTPTSHFGHPIGVDRELLDWDKVVSYFQALAKSSNKIVVKELGKTTEGRPFIAATSSLQQLTLRRSRGYVASRVPYANPQAPWSM